jgi:hypothetical protein
MIPDKHFEGIRCQLCGQNRVVATCTGKRHDLALCKACAIDRLPILIADAALADAESDDQWEHAHEQYEEVRRAYWLRICDGLDDIPEGLFEDEPPLRCRR